MISYQVERFPDFIGEAIPLLERHWNEVARNRDAVPLRIDHVRYAKLDERDALLICTARDGAKLVGYAVYFLMPFGNLHYVGTPWAESDVFWLDPNLRLGRVALRLFEFTEQMLRERGIVVMHTRAKNDHPAAGALLQHIGHAPIETVYSKFLGR